MKKTVRGIWFLVVPALLAAASRMAPEELVNLGNAALARGDYAAAQGWYQRAGERITDPGLVAFNRGVTFYHQGDPSRAEIQFRLCRSDAAGFRRARTLYNLAACLLQQAGERDFARLTEAIDLYEECLRLPAREEDLVKKSQHNLELARLLLAQARARPPKPPEDPPTPDRPASKPPLSGGSAADRTGSTSGTSPSPENKTPRPPERGPDSALSNQTPPPGAGNLDVIPDKDELVPISPEEAARHLQEAVQRVLQEQQAFRQRTIKAPLVSVRDW
jgi:tetratricopeptide (TPR) repeat protein